MKFLEDETTLLRRRLTNSPRQVKILEEQLLPPAGRAVAAIAQNEKLATVLRSERDRLAELKEEVEKLTRPPATFGVFLREIDDEFVDIFTSGRKMRVNVDPSMDRGRLRPGVEVILNEALNVVECSTRTCTGEVVSRQGADRPTTG